jgi:hypothetical protein
MVKSGHIPVSRGERSVVSEMHSGVQAPTRYRARFGNFAASLDQLEMAATRSGYAVVASPRTYLIDGRRTFYVCQSGLVRESRGERPASGEVRKSSSVVVGAR